MKPYLSVVITGRNDGYGENFLLRLNTFIKSLDHQIRYNPYVLEIILVEWNPPEDTLGLVEVVHRPRNCFLRVITVPKEVHDTYDAETPMLEYAAKNVGIVRARGEFVLVTNPDIIMSDFIVRGLSQKILEKDTFYRTDRYDYYGNGIENVSPENYMKFALGNTFNAQLLYATARITPQARVSIFTLPYQDDSSGRIHTNACGDFILASKEAFFNIGGLWERNTVLLPELPESGVEDEGNFNHKTQKISSHYDTFTLFKFASYGYKQQVISAPYCIFHMDHARQPIKDEFNPDLIIDIIKSNHNNLFWGHQEKTFNEIVVQQEQVLEMSVFQHMVYKTLLGYGDSDKHAMTLFGMVLSMKPTKILELGVRQGHTTLPLLYAAKECMSVVHSVDIEPTTFNCPPELSLHWLFFQSDAIKYLEQVAAANDKYDMIYIDDWHSYDHVKRELELIDKISDENTVILLHDLMYSNYQPDYHSNVNDPDPQWANGGPYRAVAELPRDKWEYATIPTNHGLTILRKRGRVLP